MRLEKGVLEARIGNIRGKRRDYWRLEERILEAKRGNIVGDRREYWS